MKSIFAAVWTACVSRWANAVSLGSWDNKVGVEQTPDALGSNARVLFIVHSCPQYYETRLKPIWDTWGQLISPDLLMITSTKSATPLPAGYHHASFVLTECPENHGLGLCCKEAESYKAALQYRNFDWAFVVDDDAYVLVDSVKQVLGGLNPHEKKMWGKPGCGPGSCKWGAQHGMCGGGGYALSRSTLEHMFGGHHAEQYSPWYQEHQRMCDFMGFDDLATACMAQKDGVELAEMAGCFPDQQSYEGIVRALAPSAPKALVFHYIVNQYEFKWTLMKARAQAMVNAGLIPPEYPNSGPAPTPPPVVPIPPATAAVPPSAPPVANPLAGDSSQSAPQYQYARPPPPRVAYDVPAPGVFGGDLEVKVKVTPVAEMPLTLSGK